jgi:hypothetical protein
MCLPVQPFKIERKWQHAGLSCAVTLAREAAHRCGYVRVPPSHPLWSKDYNDVPYGIDENVHGGLTFAALEPCAEHIDGQGWWFGFDCNHCNDASYDPAARVEDLTDDRTKELLRMHRECGMVGDDEHYWTEAEVVVETERLAKQLAEITSEVIMQTRG